MEALLERINRMAATYPQRAAHVSAGRVLTYAELARRSDDLAAHLLAALPDDRSPVALAGHKEPEMLIGFLGSVKAGHPYVPLDSSMPAERVRRIVAGSGARLLLTPADIHAVPAGPAPDPACRLQEADVYYIIYTSGSTGEPKGCQITLACLTNFVHWQLSEQQFGEGTEVFLNQAPFSFDLSVMDLYLSLASGGTSFSLTRAEIDSPKRLFQSLAACGATTWVSTPSFADFCLAERTFGHAMLPAMRRFLFCGETLPPTVAGQLLQRFPAASVWNTYGPTETTVCVTSVQITASEVAAGPLPVGRPGPGNQIAILDERLRPLPAGQRGEIVILGRQVAAGYRNNSGETAARFIRVAGQRAYRTGDWGRLQGGQLFCEGRMDFQVKLHGYRIELGEIEAALHQLAGVEDAAVVPVTKNGRAEYLAAWVVLRGRPADDDFALGLALRSELAALLPSYMLPRHIRVVSLMPMTANGKVDRRRLAEALA